MDITTGEMSIAQFLRARYLSILLRRLNFSRFTSAKRAEINSLFSDFSLFEGNESGEDSTDITFTSE